MRFLDTKSQTLNLRVSPSFKQALKEAADHEQRSMVNMLEVLLGDYMDRKGLSPAASEARAHTPKRTKSPKRSGALVGATA